MKVKLCCHNGSKKHPELDLMPILIFCESRLSAARQQINFGKQVACNVMFFNLPSSKTAERSV